MESPNKSRFGGRTRVVVRALAKGVIAIGRRLRPTRPRRILIAHHLLLGDTLMLTPLLAKLRAQHPDAEIVMALADAYAPLYAREPYGVRALGWNPRSPSSSALWRERNFDIAYVPGDNRFGWLALALGSRWIVGFAGDRPAHKSLPIDELRRYSAQPMAWADMVATLADGPPARPFVAGDWTPPPAAPFDRPAAPYAVLHVGASTPLKRWASDRWLALATWLAARDVEPVWSAGRGEEAIAAASDPEQRYRSYAGQLALPQMWQLLANAALVVAPDTGIAHLGRVVGTPTVSLFGPGSALLNGGGEFWRDATYRAVTVTPFPCRDQRVLFKREIEWVRRCGRSIGECPHPLCMDAIELEQVTAAIGEMGVAV